MGAVNRLNDLIKTYPNAEIAPKAHILLAHSYIKLKDPIQAKKALTQLVEKYPTSDYASDAKESRCEMTIIRLIRLLVRVRPR